MYSEELGINYGIFEGILVVHIVSKNIVVGFLTRYRFFEIVQCIVRFWMEFPKR